MADLGYNKHQKNEEDKYDFMCIDHRRKNGLICNDLYDIDCEFECKVESTCPLNPKHDIE